MSFLKIPLIVLLIFSILHIRAASLRSHKKNRRSNADSDASDNCFCFPKSVAQAPISNIIDPNNNGLERVVIYLYRDIKSQIIKVYTPAKEKQNLIPDLPFETGDTLDSITTETIAEVFDSNFNKVKVNVTRVPETENQPEIDVETNESGTNEDNFGWIINNEIPDIESVPFAVSPSDVSNQFPIDEILSYHPMHTDSQQHLSLSHDHNHNHNEKHNHYFDSYNNLLEDSNELLPEDSQPVIYNDQPIDPQPSVQPSILNSTIFNYNRNINSKNYVTFDKWFAEQMVKFNSLNGQTSVNTIDIYILKALTEKTLQENNIYVSADGVLTNAHGAVIDFSNLMLRPILIGDLVAYQNVLKETNKFKIPTNSPYLEALLITLVNPPKVLGIIPLGVAVLPSQLSSSSLSIPNDKNSEEISSSENSHLTQRKFGNYGGRRILPGYLKVPTTDQNYGHTKNSNRKAPKKNLDLVLRKAKADKLEKEEQLTQRSSKSPVDNDDESDDSRKGNRSKIRKILKNFYRLLLGGKKEKDNQNQIDDYDSNEDIISEENIEEKHKFRIIGGNAATSSGTPINNKGRSGLIA